jgi:hypothetical protein
MHTILAVAAAHGRCANDATNPPRTKREAYHSYVSAQLFNQMLSRPAAPNSHGDSLWATAALLGMMAVTSLETSDPEEAWPLRPSHPSDLQWFRLNEEKKAVWNLTNPLRPGGLFQTMADEYAGFPFQIPPLGAEGLPTDLAHVCGLNASSTRESSPYFTAAHVLAQIQSCLDRGEHVGVRMISFVSQSQASFKCLLQQKDPVALMLLARWYAHAQGALWWVQKRARAEGQAIRIYLERLHHDHGRIRLLLPSGDKTLPT